MPDNIWTVEYYDTENGRQVVVEEMREFGLNLGGDYIDHIQGKIWELRVSRYRAVYFTLTGRLIGLLRAFLKRTPPSAILTTERRMTDYLARFADTR